MPISREDKRQIGRMGAIRSVPHMLFLVIENHTQATDIFTHELVLALCWEESLWQNVPQFGGGPAVGFGQLEKDGRRIAKQHLTGEPKATDTFPFSRLAILGVEELSIAAVSHCLAGLFERLKSRDAALNGYAGVSARPENAQIVRRWKKCADALLGFRKNFLSFTPERVEDALRIARSFPFGGEVYDHIHQHLWPLEDLIREVQRTLAFPAQGRDVWNVQMTLNDIRRSVRSTPAGSEPLKVDGIFGSRTQQRVKEYQTLNALVADGVVGPKTRASLLGTGREDLHVATPARTWSANSRREWPAPSRVSRGR